MAVSAGVNPDYRRVLETYCSGPGIEVVTVPIDVSEGEPRDQVEQILGEPEVDAAIDAVGFEARGHGLLDLAEVRLGSRRRSERR